MLCTTLVAAGIALAPPPSAAELLRDLGFDAEARAELRGGEVVTEHPAETAKNELAVCAAVLIPAPVGAVTALMRSSRFIGLQPDVAGWTDLGGGDPASADLALVRLTPADRDEVELLLEAEAGDDLNFSAPELRRLRAVGRRSGTEASVSSCRAVTGEYRALLRRRLKAYRAGGVAVIASYGRDNDESASPADELRRAASTLGAVERHWPAITPAFVAFAGIGGPALDAPRRHRFALIHRTVEDRPTFILAHHVLLEGEDSAIVAERQFYVGHSYNSAQSVFILRAVEGGTLLIAQTRSATDHVTGLRRPVAKRVGRGRLADAVEAHLRAIHAAAVE